MPVDYEGIRAAEQEAQQLRWGLAAGTGAALLALTALPAVARVPFGLLGLDVAMAWGLLSLLRLASRNMGLSPDAMWFVALGAFLPVPFLARFLAARSGVVLPAVVRHTWLLEVLVLGAALGLLVALHRGGPLRPRGPRPAWLVALVGGALSVALLILAVLPPPQPRPGAVVVGSATLLLLALALLAQRLAARRMRGTRFEVFGSAAALLLAGTQLLDGIVSYLSVRDPLGVLAVDFSEQVAVSAWLIENTGPGYALAKWTLALFIVYAIEGRTWPARPETATTVATYLFVALLGIGPGLFSATRLLG